MTANRASERAGRREPAAEAVLVLGPATAPGDGGTPRGDRMDGRPLDGAGLPPDGVPDAVPDGPSRGPARDVVLVTDDGPRTAVDVGDDGTKGDGGDAGGDSPDAVIHLGAAAPAGNSLHLCDLTGLSMRLEEALAAGDGGLVRFEALDSLVVTCDLPRLVRFLRTELPRALANGYDVRARLDPAVVDRRTARAVAGAFDRCIDCRV